MNGLHLYSAFLTSVHSKCFTILPHIHPFIYTFIQRWRSQPCKVTASSSGAVRLRRLARGHLDTLGVSGMEPATFWQPAHPLHLLSPMPPRRPPGILWSALRLASKRVPGKHGDETIGWTGPTNRTAPKRRQFQPRLNQRPRLNPVEPRKSLQR